MRYDFDLIVIGTGAGGGSGAHQAARLGKKVAIVEKDAVGGECPNFACIPTKALLHAAEAYDTVKNAGLYGTKTGPVTLDYKAIHKWKCRVVANTGTSHGKETFTEDKITFLKGQARFVSPHEIQVGTKRYTAAKFLIATGSSVFIPPIPGLQDAGYITFKEAAGYDEPLDSIFILGSGAVGCEFTQIFATFGTKVYLADNAPRVLGKEDPEVSELVEALFANRGVVLLPNATIQRITKYNGKKVVHYEIDGKDHTVAVAEILIATGKRPNIDLDLEKAGVATNKHGIVVNKWLQTTASHIYAAGDVVGPYLFTHTGQYQSDIAAHNAFSYQKISPDYTVVPRAVFLDPEVASVGLTETEAKEKHIRIKKGVAPIAILGRANTDNSLDGFVKVITNSEGRLLGGAIVAPHAGEMIHQIALGIKLRADAEDIADMIHAYPTYSQAIKLACTSLE